MKKVMILAAILTLAICGQAYADYSFNFSFGDYYGESASGSGSLTGTYNGGIFTATSGVATVTMVNDNNQNIISTETFQLVPGQDLQGSAYGVTYDNLLSPNGAPVLTSNGLLFANTQSIHQAGYTDFLSIWANSATSYGAIDGDAQPAVGWTFNYLYGGNSGASGTFGLVEETASPTPIPGAAWLFGSGLAGLIGLKRKYLG